MELQEMIKLLHATNCSCVISNRETRIFSRPGVIDIYQLLQDDPAFLSGAAVADRVVGKAAAALMALGGVKHVYADVISSPAYELLKNSGVEVEYGELVDLIRNRTNTGPCPLESLCSGENDPESILPVIDRFIRSKTS